MRRAASALLVVLVWLILTAIPVFASNVSLTSVQFRLGPPSLIADGMLSGLGAQDVNVILDATGIPVITCINPGGKEAPGKSSKLTATGQIYLSGNDTVRKNGRSPFSIEAAVPGPVTGEAAVQFGCPNANSTAWIDFVFWTTATIGVVDAATGTVLVRQEYVCTTTRIPAAVSCTPTS